MFVCAITLGVRRPDVRGYVADRAADIRRIIELVRREHLHGVIRGGAEAWRVGPELAAAGIPVVVGGFHPTLIPDEAQRYADSVVIGDAENVWPEIVRDARGKRAQRVHLLAVQQLAICQFKLARAFGEGRVTPLIAMAYRY